MQKTERTTVMADLLQKADYSTPAKKKRLVESERQRMLKAANTVNADTESYLGGTFGDRRQKAILSYLDRAEKEFCAFGLTSVVEQFVKSELIPFNNYNHLDEDNDLRIGAALWILDKLRENGTLRDAFGILPDISGNVDAWYLPIDFSHPCYDVQLIQSFIHLISKRYSDGRNVVITEQNAVGRKPCEAYEQLLELLPEKSIETACEAFRAKQWELVTRFMKGQAYYDRELERSVREIQQSQSMITAPFAKPGVSIGRGSVGGGFGGSIGGGSGFGSIGSFGTIGGSSNNNAVDIALRGQELIEQSNDYFLNFDRYLQTDKTTVRRETSRQVAEALDGFSVSDPYEMCFALFYLIDHGDDAPWLLRSGSSLMLYVSRMLPWHAKEEMNDEEWDEWCDGIRYDRNGWLTQKPVEEQIDYYHEKHGDRNLAQIIYDLCRTVIPTGLHPFEADRQRLVAEGMDETKAKKLTDTAELMFLYEFQARQRVADAWSIEEEIVESESKTVKSESKTAEPEPETVESKPDTDIPIAPKLGGYWGKVMGLASEEETGEKGTGESTGRESAEKENDRLKAELL